MKFFCKEILPFILILLGVILFRVFIATPIQVLGQSMSPTLNNGETMILYKIYDMKRFDVVVIQTEDDHIIKRVIGLPGERIKCVDNVIYINDKPIFEGYSKGTTYDFKEITIPEDEYFVLGDNREDSLDSRYIGTIKKDKIMGTTNFILFPISKMQILY